VRSVKKWPSDSQRPRWRPWRGTCGYFWTQSRMADFLQVLPRDTDWREPSWLSAWPEVSRPDHYSACRTTRTRVERRRLDDDSWGTLADRNCEARSAGGQMCIAPSLRLCRDDPWRKCARGWNRRCLAVVKRQPFRQLWADLSPLLWDEVSVAIQCRTKKCQCLQLGKHRLRRFSLDARRRDSLPGHWIASGCIGDLATPACEGSACLDPSCLARPVVSGDWKRPWRRGWIRNGDLRLARVVCLLSWPRIHALRDRWTSGAIWMPMALGFTQVALQLEVSVGGVGGRSKLLRTRLGPSSLGGPD